MEISVKKIVETKKISVKPNYVKFDLGKMKYLSSLWGKSLAVLFFTIDHLLTFNKNKFVVTSDFINLMESEMGMVTQNLFMYLSKLCEAGVLKKVKRGEYIYNPHIFYFAQDSVAKEMQNNFPCEFDDKNLKIIVDDIRINELMQINVKQRKRNSKKDSDLLQITQ